MKAYRGVRTTQYTYARNEDGPWLMFDNYNDPFQKKNLINEAGYANELKKDLDNLLNQKLKQYGDKFYPSDQIIERYKLREHIKYTGLGSPINLHYPWS